MGSINPSEELVTLAKYICKVYAPTWFRIKRKNKCTDGAKNLWFLANSSRYLSDDLKLIIDPVIKRNSFFAHSENVLIAMLVDNETTRKFAVQKIIMARKKIDLKIRTFEVQDIDLNADNYTSLLDWSKCDIYEPPLTRGLSKRELTNLTNLKFDFPCHSQQVERCVQVLFYLKSFKLNK